MATKQANGAGTLFRRKDGRYAAAMYVATVTGGKRRVFVYGHTSAETRDKLHALAGSAQRNIPAHDGAWTVAGYLDYWLASVVPAKTRPRTRELYESTIRLHIVPLLGTRKLARLSVAEVQDAVNTMLRAGQSPRTVHLFRTVLSSALSRAMREELVSRNVARLIELPKYERKAIRPWTAEEATRFLEAARRHEWELGYQLLVLYGMRRGEVLGLRWSDIDLTTSTFRVEQQIQRIDGALRAGPIKTSAGRRTLPLLPAIREILARHAALAGVDLSNAAALGDQLVLTSRTGHPVEPGNFARTFQILTQRAGVPRITVHHTRHTAATLLKSLGVPARDAQLILGHSSVTTTQQLYQHGDVDAQRAALESIEDRLLGSSESQPAEQGRTVSPLMSALMSNLQEPSDAWRLRSNENRHLTEAEMAGFLGGPGGARTLDILLKRQTRTTLELLPTSVITALHSRTKSLAVGRVAVSVAVKPSPRLSPRRLLLDDLNILTTACSEALTQRMRLMSFPYSLITRNPKGTL